MVWIDEMADITEEFEMTAEEMRRWARLRLAGYSEDQVRWMMKNPTGNLTDVMSFKSFINQPPF